MTGPFRLRFFALLGVMAGIAYWTGCVPPPREPAVDVPQPTPASAEEAERLARASGQLLLSDPAVRERAAVALLSMDHPQGVQAVLDAMVSAADPQVRVSMIRAAAFCADHRCFEAILEAVGAPDSEVQKEAASALSRFTLAAEVEAMMAYARAPETQPDRRQLLYRALGEGLAVQAVPVLLEGLQSEQEASRVAALEALRSISGRDLPADVAKWREWWQTSSHKSREDILAEHLEVASADVRLLTEQLQDLREQHDELMRLVREPDAETARLLLQGLTNRHALVRRYASFRLAALPDDLLTSVSLDDEGNYTVLRDALDDEEDGIRQSVMRFVQRAQGGYRDRLILKALQDQSAGVLVMAAKSVSSTTGPEAVARLEQLLAKSAQPAVRVEAANMLGKVGTQQSIPALLDALDDPEENVRWFAVESLSKLSVAEAGPNISAVLRGDESARVRSIAATALGELGQPAGALALKEALSDPSERVRQDAAAALLTLATGGADLMMVIAGYFRDSGRLDETRKVLERVVEQYAQNEGARSQVAEAYRQLAEVLKQQGDFAAAAAAYEKLEALSPTPEVRAELVRCWLKTDQRQPVVDALQKWLPSVGDETVLQLAVEVAELLVQEGRMAEAGAVLGALEAAVDESTHPELAAQVTRLKIAAGIGVEPPLDE